MRAGLTSILALAVTAGCGSKGSPRLEGHWVGTAADGVPAEAQADATAFAGKMDLVFSGDQVIVTHQGKKTTSAFKVAKNEDDQIVITTDPKGLEHETFTILGGDKIRWSVVPGRTITFQKKKK